MRKVNNVRPENEVGLDVVSRPRDTYVRPAAPKKDSLVSIAETLTKINPQINKYLAKKEEEKRNFEEAVGAQLYTRMQSDNAERIPSEIREMVKRGEVEGFRKLTKHHWNGLVKMQHRTAADAMVAHVLTWADRATIDDGSGQQVPISSVQDENKVMNALTAEMYRFAQSGVGGEYDPHLWKSEIEPAMEMARNTFLHRHVEASVSEMSRRQEAVLSNYLDTAISPYLSNNSFILAGEGAIEESAQRIWAATAMLIADGMKETDAWKNVATWMTAKMYDVDIDNIDALSAVAARIGPLWNSLDLQATITNHAQMSKERALDKAWKEARKKETLAQAKVDDMFKSKLAAYNHDINSFSAEDWAEIEKNTPPEAWQYLSTLLLSRERISESVGNWSHRMDEEDFYNYYEMAAQGRMSAGLLATLSSQMSKEQHRELSAKWDNVYSRNERRSDGSTGANKAKAEWNTIKSLVESAFNYKSSELSPTENSSANAHVAAISRYVDTAMRVWSLKNPNAGYDEWYLEAANQVDKYIKNRGSDMLAYEKENRNVVGKPVNEVRPQQLNNAAAQIIDRFDVSDPTVASVLNKINSAAETQAGYTLNSSEIKALGKRDKLKDKEVKELVEILYRNRIEFRRKEVKS